MGIACSERSVTFYGEMRTNTDTSVQWCALFFLVQLVVQHIKDNWYEYGPFVMAEWNISDRQAYCDYMSIVGTFASELECTVATKMNYMNLSIYREIRDRYQLKRVFHNHVSSYYRTARLLFTGNSDSGHYDVLIPD